MPILSSPLVKENPSIFVTWIQQVIRHTQDGYLVWRVPLSDENFFIAYPSDRITSEQDFELHIGQRFGGICIGYPLGSQKRYEELLCGVADGVSDIDYDIAFSDAPDALRAAVERLYELVRSKSGEGSITSLPIWE